MEKREFNKWQDDATLILRQYKIDDDNKKKGQNMKNLVNDLNQCLDKVQTELATNGRD